MSRRAIENRPYCLEAIQQTEAERISAAVAPRRRHFLIRSASSKSTLDKLRDLPWTKPRQLTHPFEWTCSNQALVEQFVGSASLDDRKRLLSFLTMDSVALLSGSEPPGDANASSKPDDRRVELPPHGGDLILSGGRIFTSDPDVPWVEAIAIRDGKVVARGTVTDIARLTKDWVGVRSIDLNGRLVIPGLNDAHMHHTPDPMGIRLPIDPVADPEFPAIRPLILEAVSASAAGTWIYGVMGERLINDRQLTRRELDELAPEHPIILLGLTNHTNVVNTAAMQRLGIDENEPDPLGGFFERFPDSSIVSGRINEYAQWAPQRCFASMATIDDGVKSLVRLAADCAQFGITTLQNMSWTPADRYVEMLKAAKLPIRVRVIRFPPSGPSGRYLGEGAAQPKYVAPRIEVSGTKWILDGTTVERAAALGRPYADSLQTRGRINFPITEIQEMLAEGLRSGDQLLLHAIGTETLEAVITAVEAFGSNIDWKARGLRIEHADGLTEDQIRRVKAIGLQIVQNPSHFLFPEIYAPRFGKGALYAAFRRLLDAGIPVGIGSDGPLNPYLGMMAAVLHPANPNEAISVSDIVHAYTVGSAMAEGKADQKGTLALGYVADCAVLSQDIFAADPSRLPETRSLVTVVDGHVIYESTA